MVERFKEAYEKSDPKAQKAFVKMLLGRELGTDLVLEALGQALKDSAFVKKFFDSEYDTQLLVDAIKMGLNNPKFAELAGNEYYNIKFNSRVKEDIYKNYKKNGGSPLYGLGKQPKTKNNGRKVSDIVKPSGHGSL
ncbi:MAG: hypothetical protein LBI79_11030 [Nitrososphaerota archaeon]|jgi:hypothetical protein|nr:hypothetical protein [Nitrososphaerota archaeon]